MKKRYAIHIGLFILTFITTTLVGAEYVTGKSWFGFGELNESQLLQISDFWLGTTYSLSFLAFLTFHEFGHYFTAVYHGVRTSLPYYIPLFVPGVVNIGSLGAVIRLRQIPLSTKQFFDIGIAGPLAGFVVSVALLIYGFATLPPMEDYVLRINPEYLSIEEFGYSVPSEAEMDAYLISREEQAGIKIGSNILFSFLASTIPSNPADVPSPYELIHYPILFIGYITLFFTALNLLPMGQLDGGHVIYGMFGVKAASKVSRITVVILLLIGGTGMMDVLHIHEHYIAVPLYMAFVIYAFQKILGTRDAKKILLFVVPMLLLQAGIKWMQPELMPNTIWLFFAFMGVRFIGLDHPVARVEHKISLSRRILGWIAILIFVLCFTPNPLQIVGLPS